MHSLPILIMTPWLLILGLLASPAIAQPPVPAPTLTSGQSPVQSISQDPSEARLPWYQIELIIFERTSQEATEGEFWPPQPLRLDLSGTQALYLGGNQSGPDTQPFLLLAKDQWQLAQQHQRLRNARGYRILEHTTWKQPVLGEDDAVWVRFPPGSETSLGQEWLPFEGRVQVWVARYLHLNVDLIRRRREVVKIPTIAPNGIGEPANAGAPTLEEHIAGYRITQQRRMRSRELHYLDHPVLGVLALITPVKQEAGSITPEDVPPQ